MTELALRTTELKNQKEKYLAWRPVGSIIVSITPHRMRMKWLEIVCDLVSPKKREQYKGISGWKTLCDHWTQDLWEKWFALQRPDKAYPHGRLLQDTTAAQEMWERDVDSQLVPLLGNDPRGEVSLTDTWLWSEVERKRLFIVVNTDADESIVKSYAGHNETLDEGNLIIHPKARIDFEKELSLESVAAIKDPDTIVHPKFSSPLSKTLVNSPSITELSK